MLCVIKIYWDLTTCTLFTCIISSSQHPHLIAEKTHRNVKEVKRWQSRGAAWLWPSPSCPWSWETPFIPLGAHFLHLGSKGIGPCDVGILFQLEHVYFLVHIHKRHGPPPGHPRWVSTNTPAWIMAAINAAGLGRRGELSRKWWDPWAVYHPRVLPQTPLLVNCTHPLMT